MVGAGPEAGEEEGGGADSGPKTAVKTPWTAGSAHSGAHTVLAGDLRSWAQITKES